MADATIFEKAYTGPGRTYGYLETDGNQIVDAATGDAVRLVGANWHGAESATKVPGGLWARNWQDMMDEMASEGLNTLRIPVSPAILDGKPVKDGIRFDLNPDLRGLDALEVLDKIVDYAGDLGIRIVIDMHRITPGVGKQESGLWYSDSYSEDDLVRDWKKIAEHYEGDPTVIGFDLFNEPSGDQGSWDKAHWSNGGPSQSDWHRAAERLGDAIGEVNPDALIFVEGVHIHDNKWYWVGGNLKGAGERPIELEIEDRLVYSPHDYPYSVQNVPWLKNANAFEMEQNFREHWGFLYEFRDSPIVIGETGGRMKTEADRLYMDTLVKYLEKTREAGEPDGGMGLLWWTWGVNSGDTAGLLDDWYTLNDTRMGYLHRLAGDMLPVDATAAATVDAREMTFDFSHSNNTHKERVFTYETRSGSAVEGRDFVASEGFIRLDKGQTQAQIDVKVLSDAELSEGDENFFIEIKYLDGRTFKTLEGVIREGGGKVVGDGGGSGEGSGGGGIETPIIVPPVEVDMPDMLEAPDAQATYNLRDSRVVLQAEAQEDGGLSFVGSFKAWGSKSLTEKLGDWTLRLEGLSSMAPKVEADDVLSVRPRGDDALLFKPVDSALDPLNEVRFSFDLDLAKMAVGWTSGGASGSAMAGSGASIGGGLEVSFDIQDIWKSGDLLGAVKVKNVSDRRIEDWSMEIEAEGFDFVPGKVHNVASHSVEDDRITVDPKGWASDLGVGESYRFGFNGMIDEGSMSTVASADFVETVLDTLSFELV
jgi:aryl-phospho-beta-D-glucosidase BglC (GH1 family)